MIRRDELCAYLDTYLDVSLIDDYGYNGLQVTGTDQLKKVVFAVDAGLEVFQRANELDADMLIVHHGLFWKKSDPRIVGVHGKRIAYLIANNINLYGVHLPLDMHDEVGNNCEIIRMTGAPVTERMGRHGNGYIGAIGELNLPMKVDVIAEMLDHQLHSTSHIIDIAKEPVKKIAAMSGASSRADFYEAVAKGVELFITGEQSDIYHEAKDYGCSVIFAGHHATEQAGIWALQRKVNEVYPGLETAFLDIPTYL